jgi:hypothetical protein
MSSIKIEDDFTLIRFQNDGTEASTQQVSSGLIQFHFGLKEALNLFLTKVTMLWI